MLIVVPGVDELVQVQLIKSFDLFAAVSLLLCILVSELSLCHCVRTMHFVRFSTSTSGSL